MLARKTRGAWRRQDLAVWLKQDRSAPDHRVRLDTTLETWQAMIKPIEDKLGAAGKSSSRPAHVSSAAVKCSP
jgi:hypothetical protein